MTCIVYKDGVMAGDRLISNTSGNTFGCMTKIFKDDYGNLLGVAGDATDIEKMRMWVESPANEDGDSPPIPFAALSDSVDALYVVAETGKVLSITKSGVFYVEGDFLAVGSGQQFARGALATGASPEEAIKIASDFDHHTGGGIDILELGERRLSVG